MPITPTSTLSKNYQALGIDEIANDIETAFTSINATDDALVVLEAQVQAIPGADATTVTVDITSADILAMDVTSVVLLPSPSVGTYYDIEKVIIECNNDDIQYTYGGNGFVALYYDQLIGKITRNIVNQSSGTIGVFKPSMAFDDTNVNYTTPIDTTAEVFLFSEVAFTVGNGTMRAIITYTVRTFGA